MVKALRGLVRFIVLVFSLLQVMAGMWLFSLRNGGHLTILQRAEQVQKSCKMLLRRLSIRLEVHGPPPQHGLLVSNHLSFLDILLYGAATPCIFISKIEVLGWPLFGQAGALAGTIFIDRSRSAIGSKAMIQVEDVLREEVCVVLFAEGTSTDGSHVLPFHPSFFEPAVASGLPITSAAVRYRRGDDFVESEVCYYGDVTFLPRLLKTLSLRRIVGRLDFSPRGIVYNNRKIAASSTRTEVVSLRDRQMEANLDQLAYPVTTR